MFGIEQIVGLGNTTISTVECEDTVPTDTVFLQRDQFSGSGELSGDQKFLQGLNKPQNSDSYSAYES